MTSHLRRILEYDVRNRIESNKAIRNFVQYRRIDTSVSSHLDGLGETAADIMSHDHLVNKLFFQIIGTVDFSKRETLGTIVDDLRASGITKVLLVVQGDGVNAIMREVSIGANL